MDNNELDYNLYVIAEMNYKSEHPNEEELFPIDWYSMNDYKYKIEAIAEALEKNIKIEETELYQNRYAKKKFII